MAQRRKKSPSLDPQTRLAASQVTDTSGLRYGRRRCGRPVLAVTILDRYSHCFEALALIHHLHHVTRDPNADASRKAHSIKDRIRGR
jgi:hypothetical protein